jgi:hypothetical protein
MIGEMRSCSGRVRSLRQSGNGPPTSVWKRLRGGGFGFLTFVSDVLQSLQMYTCPFSLVSSIYIVDIPSRCRRCLFGMSSTSYNVISLGLFCSWHTAHSCSFNIISLVWCRNFLSRSCWSDWVMRGSLSLFNGQFVCSASNCMSSCVLCACL